MKKETEIGPFGPIYTQFEGRPKDAIDFLVKKRNGECKNVFYRKEIGKIDIVWGEIIDPEKHTGYGLAHIIDKHGNEILKLGLSISSFITMALKFGLVEDSRQHAERHIIKSGTIRIVVAKNYRGISKNWIVTSFSISNKRKNRG